MNDDTDHCRELVRTADRDRYLANLFAPDDVRPHLFALHAFDAEIARIGAVVSDPNLGLIRQQWWRDTLEGMEQGEVPAHPVARALAAAVRAHSLPLAPFCRLIDAREADLHADTMADLPALEAYLGATSSVPIQLAALILVGPKASACAEAAGLAGVAFGLARALSRPALSSRLIPVGMDRAALIAHARGRLAEARRAARTMPRQALPAFLPASLSELYLARVERAAPGEIVSVSPLRRQIVMWWHARRDRF